jgi:hypothetical protein
MCACGSKHSDSQIKPIPTESHFAKFNARQGYTRYTVQCYSNEFVVSLHPLQNAFELPIAGVCIDKRKVLMCR